MGINKYFEIVSADLILWESVKTNGNGMNLEKITRLLQYIKKAVNLNNENNA